MEYMRVGVVMYKVPSINLGIRGCVSFVRVFLILILLDSLGIDARLQATPIVITITKASIHPSIHLWWCKGPSTTPSLSPSLPPSLSPALSPSLCLS